MPISGSFNNKSNTSVKNQSEQPKVDKKDPCSQQEHKINKFGVTYYNLGMNDPSAIYVGDKVQKCGLTPNQVDANFNFLHGDDIKQGKFDKNEKAIVLDRHFDGKDMSKYAKDHPDIDAIAAIGPVKISTDKVLEGTKFDDKDGILKINFNGTETNIEGFNKYPNKLSEQLLKLREEVLRNSIFSEISFSNPIGYKGENTEITVTANLKTVSGEEPAEKAKIIRLFKNGEEIDYSGETNTNTNEINCNVSVNDDAEFSTKISYPLDKTNIATFTSENKYKTYNKIYAGYNRAGSEIDINNYDVLSVRPSLKNDFYDIELPDDQDLPDEQCLYYLSFLVPQDVYKNDNDGAYVFRLNGYGINIEAEFSTIKINDVNYWVFLSEAIFNSKDNKEFKIQVL